MKKAYIAPSVKIVSVRTERGFLGSNGSITTGYTDIPEIGLVDDYGNQIWNNPSSDDNPWDD